MKHLNQLHIALVGIFLICLCRVIPHWPNFVPVIAFSVFSFKYSKSLFLSTLVPLFSIWISDLVINNIIYAPYFTSFVWYTPGTFFNVLPYALIPLIHSMFAQTRFYWIKTGVSSSILFFLISNFGVWLSSTPSSMYSPDLSGLILCYTVGLPFLGYTLSSTLFYGLLLEGLAKLSNLKSPYAV